MALTVEVGGAALTLLAQRAAFEPETRTLMVADAHFGKAQAFRRLGVPVPAGTTADNLALLDALVRRHAARAVVFLGDLLHAREALAPGVVQGVAAWRRRHPALYLTLVRGNHDAHAGDPPAEWDIEVVEEPWPLGALALCHHPQEVAGAYALAGHLHPAVTVGRGIDSLRLPCFHFGARIGVLPAFGAFTGTHHVQPRAGDRVFVVAGDAVREVPC
jgi:DNA ligase-associated metallophosphoesterase